MPAPKLPHLFRRHSIDCKVHKLKIPARRRIAFMDCDCPIWVAGRTATVVIPRQSTGTRDLKTAEAILAALISNDKKQHADALSIEECIEKYLASHKHELGERTYGQYKLHLSRLHEYCEAQAVYSMRGLNVDLLETFKVKGLPDLADTSKSTVVAKLRCFLREAFRRGWITEPLVDRVTPHRAIYAQKEPYSDEEVDKILSEALKLSGGTHAYAKHPKTFRLLLELMLETGMRVGDAIRYNPALVVKGEHLWIYTYLPQKQQRTKKPKPLEAYIPDRLKQAIDGCDWLSTKLPFFYGSSRNPTYLANEVYERMQTLGARCGVSDCRPHRLRDTFAVRKLLAGFQLEDVSRLLGHSSVKVTEAYYAKWVAARKVRLERLVAESLVNA